MPTPLEPISPELCLVDPELARAARELLPDPPGDEAPPVRALRLRADTRRRPPVPCPQVPVRRRRLARPQPALVRVGVAALALASLVPAMPSATVHAVVPARTEQPEKRARPAPPAPRAVLVVPDVCRLAYVFAKGLLQDRGFAWRIEGEVQGFAPNFVAWQRPAPGTVVLDTGAPTVTLGLARNAGYAERGSPDETPPYPGTRLRISAADAVHAPVLNPCERGDRAPSAPHGY